MEWIRWKTIIAALSIINLLWYPATASYTNVGDEKAKVSTPQGQGLKGASNNQQLHKVSERTGMSFVVVWKSNASQSVKLTRKNGGIHYVSPKSRGCDLDSLLPWQQQSKQAHMPPRRWELKVNNARAAKIIGDDAEPDREQGARGENSVYNWSSGVRAEIVIKIQGCLLDWFAVAKLLTVNPTIHRDRASDVWSRELAEPHAGFPLSWAAERRGEERRDQLSTGSSGAWENALFMQTTGAGADHPTHWPPGARQAGVRGKQKAKCAAILPRKHIAGIYSM